jgi:hypothetical protein
VTWPGRFNLVAAIEGIDTLLSDGIEADVLAAWSGTDWSSVSTNCFFDLDHQHSANPWEPFVSAGTLTITALDDSIGILTHRTSGGAESEMTAQIDRNDATAITVQDTTAFPGSGTIHLGTEAISYSSTTSTTFTGITRGMWAPFSCDASGSGTRYSQNHRIGAVSYGPNLAPKATQYPRKWVGRWIGLWRHEVIDGVMQTKAEATLLFAGRIAEIRDDPETLGTIIVADHVLTTLKETAVGRDFFSGTVADGVFIPAGVTFGMQDYNASSWDTADALTVVSSGASGANELDEGFYTLSDLFSKLNAWWASERIANNLHGTYSINTATIPGDSIRTKIYWYIPGSGTGRFKFTLPKEIAIFFGFNGSPPTDALSTITVGESDNLGELHHFYADPGWVPMRTWVSTGLSTVRVTLENVSGAFQDQYATMPAALKPQSAGGLDYGLFLFDDKVLVRAAAIDNGDGTYELRDVEWSGQFFPSSTGQSLEALAAYSKRLDDPTPTRVRQIFMFSMETNEFVNRLLYSGGVTGFNHSTYDVLPFGVGVGIPGELLSTAWETSVANMPASDKPIVVVIDKPTKISALIGSDLVLRHVFPVWKSGGLRMATWQTPTASLAIATLTESNKAEPEGRDVNHRSATLLSDRWAKNVIKVRYNRELGSENGGGSEYKGTINIEDRTAVDDAGDRGEVFTIDARNTYSEFLSTGAGIESLVPDVFIPPITMFTESMRTLRRSINPHYYDDLAPGDIVNVTDSFARDPDTGHRLVSNRPAAIVRHAFNPGGARPNRATEAPVGEVELMFVDSNRIYAYSPSALVDSTYTSGSYTAGYDATNQIIRVKQHEYSESSEQVDGSRFGASDAVRIIEVDPEDSTSPLTWTRTLTAVSGDDLTHDGLALAGFDDTKTYRIVADTFSTCQATQQDKAFQADDGDGLIEDEAQPRMYGLTSSNTAATAASHTDLPELHSNVAYGDGEPYDVGSLVGLSRLVDNLIDHKTAICSPMLGPALSNTTYNTGVGWQLVMMTPIFLSTGKLSNSVFRYAKVAPMFRSITGVSTSLRVSLCRTPPTDPTLNDIVVPIPNASVEFTTSSTTFEIPAALSMNLGIKDSYAGMAWLLIECKYQCETYGLAEFLEQERRTI